MKGDRGFELDIGTATDVGAKDINEDAFAVSIPEPALQQTKGAIAIIADGLSGVESGQEAARLAVRGFISDYLSTPETWSVDTSVSKVLASINGWLFRAQSEREATKATTLSILIMKSNTAHIVHVGDSRVLRIRGGQPENLTQSHRVVMPGGESYLSRAVGIEPLLQVDHRREIIEVGDYYVLTTDGVHDALSDARLTEVVATAGNDLDLAARCIVAAAKDIDGRDNLSCVVVRVRQLPGADADEFYARLTELPFPPDLAPGMIIDGYRVIEELHASSRSQLYLVEDSATGEKAALKAPSVNFEDDPRYIQQFITEEWIGRRLRHPRLVRVLNPPRTRSFLYSLMEPIEGRSLKQWMADNPLPQIERVQKIAGEIAAALNALHHREVLHRDLKPQNIMLANDRTIRIIDLGSVYVAALDEIVTPLDPNHLVGTLDYAAPEFHEGHSGSTQSDLYSLGTIVYELLTGKLPYGERPPVRTDGRGVRYQSALHFNPLVPVWIDGALEQAVKCDPDDRYEAISEFIYDLTHPNPRFVHRVPRPLLERNPVAFWRGVALLALALNVLLVYLLVR